MPEDKKSGFILNIVGKIYIFTIFGVCNHRHDDVKYL